MCLFCVNCGACGKEIPPELKAYHDSMRVCNECGATIPVGETVCPECGWSRASTATKSAGTASAASTATSAVDRQKARLAAQLAKQGVV